MVLKNVMSKINFCCFLKIFKHYITQNDTLNTLILRLCYQTRRCVCELVCVPGLHALSGANII